MFEDAASDGLIAEIEASQVEESALMAHRLAAIAALLSQRIREAEEADPDAGYAMITGFARTTAEVSAAMNMSPMGANHVLAQAEALDARLPEVAALLAEGKTDWRSAVDHHPYRIGQQRCDRSARCVAGRPDRSVAVLVAGAHHQRGGGRGG